MSNNSSLMSNNSSLMSNNSSLMSNNDSKLRFKTANKRFKTTKKNGGNFVNCTIQKVTVLNNPIIILGSGLINGGPKYKHPLAATPIIKRVTDGNLKGSFVVKVFKVKYALMYELRFTTDVLEPEANWKLVPPVTSTSFYVEGLETGTKIWIQVRSLNTMGQSDWSNPVYFLVR